MTALCWSHRFWRPVPFGLSNSLTALMLAVSLIVEFASMLTFIEDQDMLPSSFTSVSLTAAPYYSASGAAWIASSWAHCASEYGGFRVD